MIQGTAEMQVELERLRDAVSQILSDFDKTGQSVCLLAKAQLRIAFEPFREADDDPAFTLAEAKEIDSHH